MTSLRRHLLDRRALALGLALLVLAVKLLVPAGFMVGVVDGRAVLQICSGTGPVVAMRMAGGHGGHAAATHGHERGDEAQAETPCPFAALTQSVAVPIDAAAVAAPVLAAMTAIPMAMAAAWPSARHLRPPPRGPPLRA
ncbi:hypothetical protein LPN01_11675 [Sphingomonas sp. A2-49]|uniref:DUF2946 family protein n=1 Tax=Sphingomonas sp. A2-49 TaxID=1391375 RepID=UPI0021CFDA51|nr:DUF2946 family protein [Sphingomonas sp. A2-49]MCU6454736.1 hypothetical protein [Sphingomonas sp. A2-49]